MNDHTTPQDQTAKSAPTLGSLCFSIKCNIKAPHRFMRMGALCWIVNINPGGGGDHVEVMGVSRGGRRVRTWIDTRDLHNFRSGWMPDHIRAACYYAMTAEKADDWAKALNERYGYQPVRDHAAKFGSGASS